MHNVTSKNACYGKEVGFGELFNYQVVTDINKNKTCYHHCHPMSQPMPKFTIH
jgi:hypothetical protein